jgi:hypothetical protein
VRAHACLGACVVRLCEYMCVCVRVYGGEEEGEQDGGRGGEEHVCACVCVCARVRVYDLRACGK